MDKLMTYVLLGLVITTVYTGVLSVNGPAEQKEVPAIHSAAIQAKELAVSGVEFAVRKLEEQPAWASTSTPEQITMPGVLIEATPTTWQDAVGPVQKRNNACFIVARSSVEDASARVEAVIERPGVPTLPHALRYALVSGDDLVLNDNMTIRDATGRRRNANIHTNGNLAIRRSTLVQGFGTYSSTLTEEKVSARAVFRPNVNRGGIGVFRHPIIHLPDADPARWEQLATRVYASSTTLTGDLNIGTEQQPGIWLIKGHLNLKASVRGTGIILVEGDLRLYGGNAASVIRNEDEHLCIVAAGNVFAENAKQTASIVAGGSVYSSGNVFLYGSLLAHGAVRSSGTLDIYYRPLPAAVASLIWSKEIQPPRIAMYFE